MSLWAELPNFQNNKTAVRSRQFHNDWLSQMKLVNFGKMILALLNKCVFISKLSVASYCTWEELHKGKGAVIAAFSH